METRDLNQDKISVVIPAYNSAQTLEEAVRSVMNQTYENIEVVIVDDGSKDNTPEVIEKLKEEFPGIVSVRKENGGVSAARNDGIALATGDWLVTLDADDCIEREMLARMHYYARNHGLDLCICGYAEVDKDGKRQRSFRPDTEFFDDREAFTEKMFRELYMKHLISTHSNKLYRLPLIRAKKIAYDPAYSINEDIDFCLRYMNACESMGVVRGVFLNYRQHETGGSQITTFRTNGLESALKVLRSYNEYFDALDLSDELINFMNNRILEHICSFAGLMYYRSDYSRRQILGELRMLCGDAEFRLLLRQTTPDQLKNSAASLLLGMKAVGLYDLMCRLLYRRIEKVNTLAETPGAAEKEKE